MSMPMHPARLKTSVCTGDGPASPELSSTIDAPPDLPSNTRSCVQTIETVVGALPAKQFSVVVAFRRTSTAGLAW
jgi:hypothetical protein